MNKIPIDTHCSTAKNPKFDGELNGYCYNSLYWRQQRYIAQFIRVFPTKVAIKPPLATLSVPLIPSNNFNSSPNNNFISRENMVY